ncbi:MAG: GNAT family N-acetyltransferase [Anaerolineales bacterium]|nr:GNAT family N-acetyltransferase [Anaerolineales bacterium]
MNGLSADKYIYLADQPALIPILADWYYDEWGHSDPSSSRERMRQILSGYLSRDKIPLIIVLLRGSQPIASASLKIREMETRPQYLNWLGGVYVHPDYRDQGIGSQLVEYSANEAKNLRVNELFLYTRSHEEFYTRLGWQVIEKPSYEGRLAIVMRRILSVEAGKEKTNVHRS